MVFINSNTIKEMYYANLLYEIHKTLEKTRFFEKKYGLSLDSFEKDMKLNKEDFTKWDDYMEWKAYVKMLDKLNSEKKDLEVGNYQVS